MKLYEYIMDKVSWCITLAPFMCLLFVCSCRTIKYVPVESYADSVVVEKLVEVSYRQTAPPSERYWNVMKW